MPRAARVGDNANCPADAHGCPACPHNVTGPGLSGSPNVFVNSKPVMRMGDLGIHAACCAANKWEVAGGSKTVLVNNKALARMGDMSRHCGGIGLIVKGSKDVIVG